MTPPGNAPPAVNAGQGIAVLARGGAEGEVSEEDAYAAARTVYATPLRPRGLDELRARILAGGPVPKTASPKLHELAELRASIRGEDAASRRLLASIAAELGVQGILVIHEGHARLFLADSGEFDAATYARGETSGEGAGQGEGEGERDAPWKAVVRSLEQRFPATPPPRVARPKAEASSNATAPARSGGEGEPSRPFYASPWFWGGVGAALLLGGGFYLASRDTSDDTIHLQMRVPR